jgi:hypothetical protein
VSAVEGNRGPVEDDEGPLDAAEILPKPTAVLYTTRASPTVAMPLLDEDA